MVVALPNDGTIRSDSSSKMRQMHADAMTRLFVGFQKMKTVDNRIRERVQKTRNDDSCHATALGSTSGPSVSCAPVGSRVTSSTLLQEDLEEAPILVPITSSLLGSTDSEDSSEERPESRVLMQPEGSRKQLSASNGGGILTDKTKGYIELNNSTISTQSTEVETSAFGPVLTPESEDPDEFFRRYGINDEEDLLLPTNTRTGVNISTPKHTNATKRIVVEIGKQPEDHLVRQQTRQTVSLTTNPPDSKWPTWFAMQTFPSSDSYSFEDDSITESIASASETNKVVGTNTDTGTGKEPYGYLVRSTASSLCEIQANNLQYLSSSTTIVSVLV